MTKSVSGTTPQTSLLRYLRRISLEGHILRPCRYAFWLFMFICVFLKYFHGFYIHKSALVKKGF